MDLLCLILLCVRTSVTLASLDQRAHVEEEPASGPYIQHLIERVDALERQSAKQANKMQTMRAIMSQQASEIQTLRSEMSQQASEIQTLRADMLQQASEIHTLRAEMSQQANEIQFLRAEMSQQASEIQTLRSEMSQQASEIHTLRADMLQQANEIQTLRAEMLQQASEIQTLRAEMSQQANEIQTHKAEMSQQKSYIRQLRSKLHTEVKLMQTSLNRVSKPINSDDLPTDGGMEAFDSMTEPVSDENKQRQVKCSPVKRIIPVEDVHVAFSASFVDRQTHMNNNQHPYPIVFDNVETNVGNGYNVSSGVFTVPVSGVYVFSASVLSLDNTAGHAYLILNKNKKAYMYMKGVGEMAGQTMVLKVDKGDHVLIAIDTPEFLYGQSIPYTTFSGFLLHQTFSSTNDGILVG